MQDLIREFHEIIMDTLFQSTERGVAPPPPPRMSRVLKVQLKSTHPSNKQLSVVCVS